MYHSRWSQLLALTQKEYDLLLLDNHLDISESFYFCGLITKAFVYSVQWGRKQEFNESLIRCHSAKFLLWRTRCLQDSLRPSSAPKIREKDCCWPTEPSSTQDQPSREFKHTQNFKFITSSFDFSWSAHVLKMLVDIIDTVRGSNIFVTDIGVLLQITAVCF